VEGARSRNNCRKLIADVDEKSQAEALEDANVLAKPAQMPARRARS
jgi:hypothetical protein